MQILILENLKGQDEKEAVKQITAIGMIPRIVERDGQHFIHTCEYNPNRVNLSITEGKVTAAANG